MTWEHFFVWLMDREGRVISNDQRDYGGQTCWGISRKHHPLWDGWHLVDRDVTSGPELERMVSEFYRSQYGKLWDTLPDRLREVAVDTAVNMGQSYAVQCLQDALNRLAGSQYVDVDGRLGPQTKDALKHADPSAVAFSMCALRLVEYSRRAHRDGTQVFLRGWINRVRDIMAAI